jgi:pyruvate kinase
MKRTKIVCTLGPSCMGPGDLEHLAEIGMNVARINLSHGSRPQHQKLVDAIRALNKKRGNDIAVLLDTKGAEIRTGDVAAPIAVTKGDEVDFVTKLPKDPKRTTIEVTYKGFSQDVRGSDVLLIDNGEMIFDVLSIAKDGTVRTRARDTGTIGSRRHINIPGADIGLPAMMPEDWDALAWGIKEGADFVALSFIRTAEEVLEVRRFLNKHKSPMEIITKIETAQAIKNIEEIVEVSDGIMVARGDLGAEIPFERIPAAQGHMVRMCREAGKPVIVATHMLESMRGHPMPTRAEVTDVAHAAVSYTDATMLSAETASGKYPFAALDAMVRILEETEKTLPTPAPASIRDPREAQANAAVKMAADTDAPAIVVFTRTGKTAIDVSKYRPSIPVIAITEDEGVQRRLALRYGITALNLPLRKDPEETVKAGLSAIKNEGMLKKNQRVLVLSDAKGGPGTVSTIQLRTLA